MTDPHVLFADLSSNNPSLNAHAYKSAGHKVIAIKATEHTDYVNPRHAEWAHAAHAAGLAVVHYHFCRPENGNPVGQAVHFWQSVRSHYLRGRDRLAFDLETGEPGSSVAWLREADKHLCAINGGAPGDEPIGYTFLSYFEAAPLELTSAAWWIAAWGAKMRQRQKLARGQYLWAQQYTDGTGYGPGPQRFAGIPGICDGSIINKRTLSLIEKALGSKPPA